MARVLPQRHRDKQKPTGLRGLRDDDEEECGFPEEEEEVEDVAKEEESATIS
jgi:hypothetical protein